MKKEIFASVLLLLILSLAIINIKLVNAITCKTEQLINEVKSSIELSDWGSAEKNAKEAIVLWENKQSYTNLVLRHDAIDGVSDALYNLLGEIRDENAGSAKSTTTLIIGLLNGISDMEKITFGTVFCHLS